MRVLLIILMLFLTCCPHLSGAVKQEELDERNTRLTAHLQCFARWVDEACDLSERQQNQLNERIEQAIAKSQRAYQFPEYPHQIQTRQSRLYDYSPIRFVGIRGAAWGVYQAGLNDDLQKILNETQQDKYRAAYENRQLMLHKNFLDHVINTADHELFLSEQQKEAIKNLFPEKLPLLEDGLYSFMPHTIYLNEKSIGTILDSRPHLLNHAQKKWQRYLRSNHQAVVLLSAKSEEELQKKISAEIQKRMVNLKPALELRIDYFSHQLQLNGQDQQYLKLAGKGTMIKLANQWKENALLLQKEYAKRANQNEGQLIHRTILPLIRLYGFDHHPLWEHAVRKVMTDAAYEKRERMIQQATLNYLMALLDQELWLRSEQRTRIAMIYQNVSIYDRGRYCQNINYSNSYDLSLLAAVLADEREAELSGILDDSQLAALTELKKQFQQDQDILTVNTRHGRRLLGYIKTGQKNAIQFFSRGGFIGGGIGLF